MALKYFGTDGIRGKVGEGELFTKQFIRKVANAVAQYVMGSKDNGDNNKLRCVVGCDTRESSQWIVDTITDVMSEHDIKVFSVGVVPTAALSYLAKHYGADLGIMITASHNPHEWNGIKLFNANGKKLEDSELEKIERCLESTQEEFSFSPAEEKSTATYDKELQGIEKRRSLFLSSASKENSSCACKQPWVDFLITNFSHLKLYSSKQKPYIILDCANGSGGDIAVSVLRSLGFRVRTINNSPDGKNINEKCGATNTKSLQDAVRKSRARSVIGFAFDGDADRCVCVTKQGEVAGERILGALAICMGLDRFASTILFNSGAEKFLSGRGIQVIKTKVGDRHVLQAVHEHDLSLGGEPNGHIVFPHININGDGLIVVLMVLQIMIESGLGLDELTQNIPVYPSFVLNIRADSVGKEKIESEEFKAFLQEVERENKDYKIIVRPSGTEDLVRITVEGMEREKCESIAKSISGNL